VMKLARDHKVPVLLQGHGGDELFWGYSWMRDAVRHSARKAARKTTRYRGALAYLEPEGTTNGSLAWRSFVRCGQWMEGVSALFRDTQSPPDELVLYNLLPQFRAATSFAQTHFTGKFLKQMRAANPSRFFTRQRPWAYLDVLITRMVCD